MLPSTIYFFYQMIIVLLVVFVNKTISLKVFTFVLLFVKKILVLKIIQNF